MVNVLTLVLLLIGCSIQSSISSQVIKSDVTFLKSVDSLYSRFASPSYTISRVKLSEENFKIGPFRIQDSIDFMLKAVGQPLQVEQHIGLNGQHYSIYFFDGLSCKIFNEKIVSITAVRDDLSTPDNIRSGLKLDEVKNKFPKAIFKDIADGKVLISSTPVDDLLLVLLVTDGKIKAVQLRSGAD
jgi:hypothetical protein